MRIRKKTIFPLLLLLLLHFSELIMDSYKMFKYCDEIYSVLFTLIIIAFYIKKYRISEKKNKTKILLICCLIMFVGILSNVFSHMQKNYIAILLDIVANFKFPICCIGFSLIVDRKSAEDIIKFFKPISKTFITIGFVCSLISLVTDIGMRGQMRFGIWGFEFIYHYAHIFSMVLLFNLIIVALTVKEQKIFKIYLLMAVIQLILTTKGTSIVAAVAIVMILWMMKNRRKFKLRNLIPIGVVGVFLGTYQIETYFLNANTPRALLLKYAFITLDRFFPLGSGFATYGSDMANKYYSDLYMSYGFNDIWGMHKGSLFLNDNYWPMIVGQFGIVGFVGCIVMIYTYYFLIQKNNLDSRNKAIIISCLFYILLASLGTTIFTTSATIILSFGMILAMAAFSNDVKG